MNTFIRTQTFGCICLLAGCGDLAANLSEPEAPDSGVTSEPTSEEEPTLAVDAGTSPDPAIPLAFWVEGLVDQGASETAVPDTVDDKNIEDTDDPHAFDAYF